MYLCPSVKSVCLSLPEEMGGVIFTHVPQKLIENNIYGKNSPATSQIFGSSTSLSAWYYTKFLIHADVPIYELVNKSTSDRFSSLNTILHPKYHKNTLLLERMQNDHRGVL